MLNYEYGVTYPNLGKPNLPDDVLVEYKCVTAAVWSRPDPIGRLRWAKHRTGGDIACFRIVDERYKPAHLWSLREELPPAGETVESAPYWHTCYVVCDYEGGRLIHDKHDDEFYVAHENLTFRPIYSERDKKIEELIADCEECGVQLPRLNAATLVDKGWNKDSVAKDTK